MRAVESKVSHTDPTVSILVVSYNTRELTLDAIGTAITETSVPSEIIVVDNASSDGSAEAVAAAFPGLTLLAEPHNHGFARANNLAASRATGEFLLLLNPDTVVLDRAIDKLISFARRHPDARIWGGRTLFPDGSLNRANCWSAMTMWKLVCRTAGLDTAFPDSSWFNAEAYGGWDRNSERRVDIVSGCFFLIDHGLWRDLDGFDERFVMYGEEADLCLRAARRGARPMVTHTAEIVHYGGASETVRNAKHQRLLRAKISLVRRHFPRWQRTLGVTVLRLWPLSRTVAATAIARIRPTDTNRNRADEWQALWAERRSWWNGYPNTTAADAAIGGVTNG